MRMRDWVMLPTTWIHEGGLTRLRWVSDQGADNIAALTLLMTIAHRADAEMGEAKLTHTELGTATGLSRAKIAGGLDVLTELQLLKRRPLGRSTYRLAAYDRSAGWGKLPARQLYVSGEVQAFHALTLRQAAELHALKLYLLFVALRDNGTNLATISYDKIVGYTGLERAHVKRALSLLTVLGLVHTERTASQANAYGVSNSYRLAHLDPYNHMGTRGRTTAFMDFAEGEFAD
ncbi:hypothetical protein [Methylobacterium isbiliense]|uniref:Uncharacterized protein n=1 Tax=Methylobacterium isbiliense TaxID=315478 RepID=A0ABQ4SLS1_9HYPH|nr:hypothetical protein [Methylobacterium isbiliense]MDN3627892.1 hypothetical protein [Methylobacterium isbiliense]GJE02709.1 hypothetical protein GMJLKIPL_4658 [Methylobacterium isbiliense]